LGSLLPRVFLKIVIIIHFVLFERGDVCTFGSWIIQDFVRDSLFTIVIPVDKQEENMKILSGGLNSWSAF